MGDRQKTNGKKKKQKNKNKKPKTKKENIYETNNGNNNYVTNNIKENETEKRVRGITKFTTQQLVILIFQTISIATYLANRLKRKSTSHYGFQVEKNTITEGATYLAQLASHHYRYKEGRGSTKNTPRRESRIRIIIHHPDHHNNHRSTLLNHGELGINITGTNITDNLRWTLWEQNHLPRHKDNHTELGRATYLAQERIRSWKNWRRNTKRRERKQKNRQAMTKRNKKRTRYFFYPGRGKQK